ncbi:hypothetical protein B0H19DRAFT_1019240 [Mycena capillaripes]|nr:hypothetical protein B0H19DRAFT_1019240 [Mycena capillaripes]
MDSAAENDLEMVEQLWFSMDAVILRAQTRIFRVFVAILKEKSSVFADMFSLPQLPSSVMETMDGVPVVTLYDDPAEMEVFLKAIFDSAFFMPPPARSKFEDTLGILRLAHKYDVPYLRRRALEHLGTIYPSQLSDYRMGNLSLSLKDFHHRIATIERATEVDALWLLPTAYYDICRRELGAIIEDPHWLTLGEKERKTCLLGYQALIRQYPKMLNFLSVSKDEDDDCTDWTECNKFRLGLTGLNKDLSAFMSCPLDIWSEVLWTRMDQIICSNCMTEAKALHAAARQNCWDELPKMFGLPGWEDLEEMRQAALSA